MAVETQILFNNVTLITEPVATVKTAAVGFWFRIGSRYENVQQRGISHFVEHMLFKGTNTKNALDIATCFDKIGGYINAFTERENMCIHFVVPSTHLEIAFNVVVDMITNSIFDINELARERSVIISEIISSLDDSEEIALDAASESIWPNNSISECIAGSIKNVELLKRQDLLNWYNDFIINGQLIICAAGNINKTLLTSLSEKISKKQLKISKNLETPIWNKGLKFKKAPFQQLQFFLQFPIELPMTERKYYAYSILNALVGDTMSSRLFQKLREKGGFSYNVYSFLTFYSDTAFWCAYESSSKKNAIKVTTTIITEIINLMIDSFTDDELKAASEHLCGEEIISAEDMEYRIKRIYRNYSFNFDQRTTEEIIEILRSISKNEIEDVLHELFDLENMAFFVYGVKTDRTITKNIKTLTKKYLNV